MKAFVEPNQIVLSILARVGPKTAKMRRQRDPKEIRLSLHMVAEDLRDVDRVDIHPEAGELKRGLGKTGAVFQCPLTRAKVRMLQNHSGREEMVGGFRNRERISPTKKTREADGIHVPTRCLFFVAERIIRGIGARDFAPKTLLLVKISLGEGIQVAVEPVGKKQKRVPEIVPRRVWGEVVLLERASDHLQIVKSKATRLLDSAGHGLVGCGEGRRIWHFGSRLKPVKTTFVRFDLHEAYELRMYLKGTDRPPSHPP